MRPAGPHGRGRHRQAEAGRACPLPAPFGESEFAITRGNAFEAQAKDDGAAELSRRSASFGLDITEAHYTDLGDVGGNQDNELRHVYTRQRLTAAAAGTGTMFDHPLLRLRVAGRYAYLEPDLIAFQLRGVFHVIEIKSFAIVDGQADPRHAAPRPRRPFTRAPWPACRAPTRSPPGQPHRPARPRQGPGP